MKYKLVTLFILSLSVSNISFAEEKKNYFGDDSYYSKELKNDSKKESKHQKYRVEPREKRVKKLRRVKLKTDTH